MTEENPKNEPNDPQTAPANPENPPENGLDDIAAMLAEQVAASHTAAARCFAMGADDEDFQPAQREDALRIAARLMHASAAAANAIKRIKGGEFHYRITVDRIDFAAEKAARKARKAKVKNGEKSARAALEAKLDRLVAEEKAQMSDEERALSARLEELVTARLAARPGTPSAERAP